MLITLWAKASENQQHNPLLRDEKAAEIISKIDYDFGKFKKAAFSQAGVCVRANLIDGETRKFITAHPDAVVIQLGAGLDARYERLGCPEVTHWYELDLPEVIAIRRKLLPPQEGETLIEASAFDTGWMEDVSGSHPDAQFFLILEGVLTYFDNETVGGLFKNLAHYFHHGEAVFDVSSSWMVKNSGKHDAVKHTRARFAFGCDDDREIERWADNLHLISAKYMATDFPAWKRLGLFYWIMRLVPVLRNSYRLLHYRID